ncbi:MAG: hypothetical protein JO157_13030 [Acetobacteraceae bacterium]|nr:hypothetical protein [Acetobacteraceae bacterium]
MHAIRRAALTAPVLLSVAAAARPVPQTVLGVFALAGASPKATATLTATPDRSLPKSGNSGVPMTLGVTMTAIGAKKPIGRYDRELGKVMHLIAVSDDLRDFVHVHGEGVDKRGRVETYARFPHSGFYHVYADATPTGLGQQVFRFDLRVGTAQGASAPPAAAPLPPPSLDAADGAYAVRLDPFTLTGGQEATLRLHILHDGQPASDVTPFLGVAAHAVLISVSTLSYIHVHAQVPGRPGSGMAGMPGMDDAPPLTGPVRPDLALHIKPPQPGAYRLWLQFMAAGKVRTVAFTVIVQ